MQTAEDIRPAVEAVSADLRDDVASPPPQRSGSHLYVVEALRAFAALAVCLYHTGGPQTMQDSAFTRAILAVTSFGHLGVAVFFVISGYVIPLSMGEWRLTSTSLRLFLGRRLVRLHPPYVIASALSIFLWWASTFSPGFRGGPVALTTSDVLTNLTMTAGFFGRPWILTVAWTLAIEVQFYIAIAFVLPLLLANRRGLRLATLLAWVAIPLLPADPAYLAEYAALFGMGMAVYLRSRNLLSRAEFVAVIVVAAGVQSFVESRASAVAGLATAALLFTAPKPSRIVAGLGAISYSLYLVHVPVGGKVVNLGMRLPEFAGRGLFLMGVATIASILAAIVFHRVVEQRWIARSRAFGAKRRSPSQTHLAS